MQERPLLVVVSSDLRQHPVGRFWLPIARQLRSQFRVISLAGQPRDHDPIRAELRQLSDEWWPLEASDVVSTASRIRELAPSLLLDLGGHTADNYPQLLTQRLATVQATYLGFFGPTYAACCDWWIVIVPFWVGSNALTPERKRSGPCLAPVFAMSLNFMACRSPRPPLIRNQTIRLRQLQPYAETHTLYSAAFWNCARG